MTANSNKQDKFAELISIAEKHFEKAKYAAAETVLNQLILQGCKDARVFHMLGTIFYDKGSFTKSVRSFRRALEIDPSFTDASIGLSILLNDLGRYDEGREVFETANASLAKKTFETDPFIKNQIALKHDELGELYLKLNRKAEALEQYYKALPLTKDSESVTVKIAKIHKDLGNSNKAYRTLSQANEEHPRFENTRLCLAEFYIQDKKFHQAQSLLRDLLSMNPKNPSAQNLLENLQNSSSSRAGLSL